MTLYPNNLGLCNPRDAFVSSYIGELAVSLWGVVVLFQHTCNQVIINVKLFLINFLVVQLKM